MTNLTQSLQEKLLRDYTEFYFIHCKPELKPEFKTVDEADNWYKKQEFKIDSIVRNQVDNTIAMFEQSLEETEKRVREEALEYINEQVKKYHKTCLTDQFDNGKFWAFKEMQQKLLTQPKEENDAR